MESTYKYRTVSVNHLKELWEDINALDRRGQLSHEERYRGYLSPCRIAIPDDFPDAKFIIILARFSPLMLVNFHLQNRVHEVMMPPESYSIGMTDADWIRLIEQQIIGQSGFRIREVEKMPLKQLAVRSGLGKYGRNNICYVDEMGSFVSLHGFLTDYKFLEDYWQEAEMMDTCELCRICMEECPCSCIREENFVIDAHRCVTWYNEKKGEFPAWMARSVHNALLGCTRCQLSCPENDRALKFMGRFNDVTEKETLCILNGTVGDISQQSPVRTIFGLDTETELMDFMPVLQRNLSVLIG